MKIKPLLIISIIFGLLSLVASPSHANETSQKEEWITQLQQEQSQFMNNTSQALFIGFRAENNRTAKIVRARLIQNPNKSSLLRYNLPGVEKGVQRCTKPTKCWVKPNKAKKWQRTTPQPPLAPTLENLIPEEYLPEKAQSFNYTEIDNNIKIFSYQTYNELNEPRNIEIAYSKNKIVATVSFTENDAENKITYTMRTNVKPVEVVKPRKKLIKKPL